MRNNEQKTERRGFTPYHFSFGESDKGFTLIETLIAIWFLTMAIVAPMSLATQSLSSAYYARDQITAFQLAQDAIESIRQMRDDNVLQKVYGVPAPIDNVFQINGTNGVGMPTDGTTKFIIDTVQGALYTNFSACLANPVTGDNAPPLRTDGTFYGYGVISGTDPCVTTGWSSTNFTRTATSSYVNYSGPPNSNPNSPYGPTDELRVTVTVAWKAGGFQPKPLVISEDLFNWQK